MYHTNQIAEQERAVAAVVQCNLDLRQARENARHAGETLRRAIREVDESEAALGSASRRLERMEIAVKENANMTDRHYDIDALKERARAKTDKAIDEVRSEAKAAADRAKAAADLGRDKAKEKR